MPASLVDSQFQALEHLGLDEHGVVLDPDATLDDLVNTCLATFATPPDRTASH